MFRAIVATRPTISYIFRSVQTHYTAPPVPLFIPDHRMSHSFSAQLGSSQFSSMSASQAAFAIFTGTAIGAFWAYTTQNKEYFQQEMEEKVLKMIENSQEIPGLNSEEFQRLKEPIANTWKVLVKEGSLQISGKDSDIRPLFVALQAIIEHTLASEMNRSIKSLNGLIHTPMPATPLCTKGEISEALVHSSIAGDASRLMTVKSRATTVREFLNKGGTLHIYYPSDGLAKRTEQQRKVYLEELSKYPHQLFDEPLVRDNIPEELIGATYLFKDQNDKGFAFSIRMTQANDPQAEGRFGLWFGPTDHPSVEARINSLYSFFDAYGSKGAL